MRWELVVMLMPLLLCLGACGASTTGRMTGAILSGEVDFAGRYGDKPINQARVQLLQGDKVVADTLADENGRFKFDRVPRGGFDLSVSKGQQYAEYSYKQEARGKLLRADDESLFTNGRCFLRVILKTRQTVLKGTVVSTEGKPVPGAMVRTEPPTVVDSTNANGAYTLASDAFEEGINYAVIATQNEYDNEMSVPVIIQLAKENEVPPIKLEARKQEKPVDDGTPQPDGTAPRIVVPGSGENK